MKTPSKEGLKGIVTFLMVLGVGCASGHCRKVQNPQTEPAPITSADDKNSLPDDFSMKPASQDRVFVFKYDGSLQCNQGNPLTPQKMREELGQIKVYSMEKRHDGQMHIQVCGASTGEANVYEIAKADLEKALKKGFKL
ncbi:MAG: hypothetical protein KDD22_05435, partial [Bdellovibrionales bacterium]|nr:hypothetical protein [Bdellovibrionales bacterium]